MSAGRRRPTAEWVAARHVIGVADRLDETRRAIEAARTDLSRAWMATNYGTRAEGERIHLAREALANVDSLIRAAADLCETVGRSLAPGAEVEA